jgi:hypothetical protein
VIEAGLTRRSAEATTSLKRLGFGRVAEDFKCEHKLNNKPFSAHAFALQEPVAFDRIDPVSEPVF